MYMTCGENPQSLNWRTAPIHIENNGRYEPTLDINGMKSAYQSDPVINKNWINLDMQVGPQQIKRYAFNHSKCDAYGEGSVQVLLYSADAKPQELARYNCVCAVD